VTVDFGYGPIADSVRRSLSDVEVCISWDMMRPGEASASCRPLLGDGGEHANYPVEQQGLGTAARQFRAYLQLHGTPLPGAFRDVSYITSTTELTCRGSDVARPDPAVALLWTGSVPCDVDATAVLELHPGGISVSISVTVAAPIRCFSGTLVSRVQQELKSQFDELCSNYTFSTKGLWLDQGSIEDCSFDLTFQLKRWLDHSCSSTGDIDLFPARRIDFGTVPLVVRDPTSLFLLQRVEVPVSFDRITSFKEMAEALRSDFKFVCAEVLQRAGKQTAVPDCITDLTSQLEIFVRLTMSSVFGGTLKQLPHFIPIGTHCGPSNVLQIMGLREKDGPFDWNISPLKAAYQLISGEA
jgi:hypothetical protein